MRPLKVLAKHPTPGGKLGNDTAADAEGNVYVSDTLTNTIYRLSGGKLEVWVKDDRLAGPNGTHVEGDNLIVNTCGVLTGEGFNTSVARHVLSISLKDKTINDLGDGKPQSRQRAQINNCVANALVEEPDAAALDRDLPSLLTI